MTASRPQLSPDVDAPFCLVVAFLLESSVALSYWAWEDQSHDHHNRPWQCLVNRVVEEAGPDRGLEGEDRHRKGCYG